MSRLRQGHILGGLPAPGVDTERFDLLAEAEGVRVERIVSPPGFGGDPAWMEQAHEEFVLVVQGRARLEIDGEAPVDLNPGDHAVIPAGCRHRVARTDNLHPTVWLAVHYGSNRS